MTNCTGGEADLAVLPVFLTPALIAAAALAVLRPRRSVGILVALSVAPLLLTAGTLGSVALGWFRDGKTACSTLLGQDYPADGSEALTPWMLGAIALIFVLCVLSRIPRKD